MPLFAYRAVATSGEIIKGRVEARGAEQVFGQLRRDGHFPVDVRALRPTRWWRFQPAGETRSARDLALATRELVLLLHAGQTLEQSLHLLATGAGPKSLRPVFAAVLERLRSGASLADALEAEGGFPPLYRTMVRAGEASGAVEEQLARLADMLERTNRLQETLLSSALYPMILLVVAASAVLLLLGVVVPQFAPLFAQSTRELPLATRIVLAASDLVLGYGVGAAIALLAVLAVALPLLRQPSFQLRRDRVVLRIPIIGSLIIMMAVGRFARALGVLLKGGVSLPASLSLVRGIVGNQVLALLIDAMRSGIKDGKRLTASLPRAHPLPDLVIQLLSVGEQSGQLESALFHIADIYDARLDQSLKRCLALFEPICIVLLSLVVGAVVIAILLAVVSINDLAF